MKNFTATFGVNNEDWFYQAAAANMVEFMQMAFTWLTAQEVIVTDVQDVFMCEYEPFEVD